MNHFLKPFWSAACLAALAIAAPSANATSFSFTGTSGSLKANATFVSSPTTLTITLANISTYDVTAPNQVLTAVFFDTDPGNPTLTPLSAFLAGGSTVFFGPNVANVGGEWAYGHNLTGVPGGAAEQGTSSTGLGLFGGGNFNGANLQGPVSVDGLQYGLTSLGDNTASGNTAVTGQFALVRNAVVLTLGLPVGYNLASISNVRFLYGTSLSDVIVPGTSDSPTPTPDGGATIALLGSALFAIGMLRRKISNS